MFTMRRSMFVIFTVYYWGGESSRIRWAGHVARMEGKKKHAWV
jgi:hypothetical protein